jgi:hypothetical protein
MLGLIIPTYFNIDCNELDYLFLNYAGMNCSDSDFLFYNVALYTVENRGIDNTLLYIRGIFYRPRVQVV